MRRCRVFPVLVLVAMVVAACATTALTTTALSLSAVGDTFLSSGKMLDAAYTAKTLSEANYQKWRDFVPKFQVAYAEAVKTVNTLKAVGEEPTAAQQTALALTLKNQLIEVLTAIYLPAAQAAQ
ncbi:MAG: hypothetical protein ABFD60_07740 [Bryobacteraceae bacterium]